MAACFYLAAIPAVFAALAAIDAFLDMFMW